MAKPDFKTTSPWQPNTQSARGFPRQFQKSGNSSIQSHNQQQSKIIIIMYLNPSPLQSRATVSAVHRTDRLKPSRDRTTIFPCNQPYPSLLPISSPKAAIDPAVSFTLTAPPSKPPAAHGLRRPNEMRS
ncbi:hypothetical protein M0R45_004389 [Rubus argutus]|uniref:Uncharacterized protein n=1 Tax=Rubus argutus TaxID=59490 RepID=A0AAW1YJM1_RUBAR